MAIAELKAFLGRHSRIALDTSTFIYHVQAHTRYVGLTDEIFSWLQRPGAHAVTSTITLTELLVQPYRQGNQALADEFYGLLVTFPNLTWVVPSLEIADNAAQIRAHHGLRTPDAIQAATAIHSSSTALVTNDSVFLRISGLEIAVLEEFL